MTTAEKLSDITNRPDPPSERGALDIVQAVESVQRAVERYSKAGGQTEAEVWRQLATSGALRSVIVQSGDSTALALANAPEMHKQARRRQCARTAQPSTADDVAARRGRSVPAVEPN